MSEPGQPAEGRQLRLSEACVKNASYVSGQVLKHDQGELLLIG